MHFRVSRTHHVSLPDSPLLGHSRPLLGVVVSLPASSVPGMVRVCVGGGSDTFTDVVYRERKQEVCLHLAGRESGLLRREGKAPSGCVMGSGPQVPPGQVPPGLLNVLLPVGITSHRLICEQGTDNRSHNHNETARSTSLCELSFPFHSISHQEHGQLPSL